jgi:hypothetical protein
MTRSRTTSMTKDDRVVTASRLVIRTGIYLDIWDFYQGPGRARILDTMNKFSEFFRFDEHAHRFSFIVHIAALFEKKIDTINLVQLTKELSEAGRISAESAREIEQLFTLVKRVIRGVRIIRNNAFAHRNDSISFDEAFKMANISMNDLSDLMNAALRIMNILLITCDRGEEEFFMLPLEDVRHIFATLSAPQLPTNPSQP